MAKKTNKLEIRKRAQENIMQAIIGAFYANYDGSIDEYTAEMHVEMDKQFRRIEKLFGYEPGSCPRS